MIAAMVPLPTFPDAMVWLALPLLMAAALSDIAFRRIPNGIAVLVALVGMLRQGVAGGAVLAVAMALATVVLLGTVILWQRGVIGGGDVKLLAAASLLVPPASLPAQLLAVALAGGCLAVVHIVLRALLRHRPADHRRRGLPHRLLRREARRIRTGAPLPYGVAIALGTAAILIRPGA